LQGGAQGALAAIAALAIAAIAVERRLELGCNSPQPVG